MQVFTIVIIFFGCSFLYLSSHAKSRYSNICADCPMLENCTVNETFIDSMEKHDRRKIVHTNNEGDPAPELEKCLNPGFTISGELSDIVCSGSSDGKCHPIFRPSEVDNITVCETCKVLCGCSGAFTIAKGLLDNYFIFITAFFGMTNSMA
ncbi:uncharacterized protein Dmoj_GI27053 [Drosophila mojavensis]|uniref:Uncharacterized protein n=1 Tax=Drosophila mojavensis TaxID=7230 RepID=A0A0Q9X560_DROMO|nr:uncharacterized protein Dmoj_GI27053 [Drosophila mojavensis]